MQYLDEGNADSALPLLATDAIWTRAAEILVGHAAIQAAIEARAKDRTVRHHLSNIVVTIRDRSRATSKAYYAVYAHDGPARPRLISGPERVGDYHAEYQLTDNGWRISRLRAERIFTGGA